MSLSATFGVFVALGAVLTLLLVALRVLKRFGPRLTGGRQRLPMEVVQRLPLGPKHSIAVVRVGERVLTVAIGDGGIQQLGELSGDDRAAVLAASATPVPFTPSAAAQSGVLAALGNHPDVRALPGAAWIREALTKGRAQRAATQEIVEPPPRPAPRPAPIPASAGTDAFRSVLGMALSSATKLVVMAAVLGTLAASRAHAQPATQTPVTDSTRRAALAAVQQATALLGKGRNTQAPSAAGGKAGTPPLAPGATAPSSVAGADTMVAKLAPQLDLRVGGGKGDGLRLSGTVGVVIMMGLLTLLPTLVLMMTGFTRILIVLHFLKQALGTQNAPPNHLIAALAMLLTGFVMAPTFSRMNQEALQPWLAGRMEQTQMLETGVKPLREFMLRQTRPRDLETFVEMSHPAVAPKSPDDVSLVVVMSAFVTSELRKAFQMGFALFLPFIIIDLVVSAVLMSMGMMMLPPAMIALPCKLLLFVLVDGWTLVVQTMVQSFK